MAFGSFDLLHPGHLLYLRRARGLGDRLMVVVSRDRSIEMLKHRKPVLGERARLDVVSALRMVDRAVLGNRLSNPTDMYRILKRYKPDIIAFGYDQRVDIGGMRSWLKENGLKSKIVLIKARRNIGSFKSAKLRERLLS
jgi:FAD synthetase